MKILIKWKIILTSALLLGPGFLKTSEAQQKFEKSVFYNVMASGDLDAINKEITIVQDAQTNNKEGYEGALLMKKAGLLAKPKQRLKFFKDGRIKLETALLADDENTEFHFLRLAIEEHAPKIVKYHSNIENDKLFIQKNFKNLSPVVQHAILDYCKNSKVLQPDNF
ncbi:hypothetical protein [Mucilaginibacter sp.]|uniref:hypothetical protein n=1 Tax=Mucilaginibacter sp. TaxID=1882438 RepID=UPI0028450E92|nr:hypothetical protein [Mucilaginibacter sp.]MDR3697622.1 hypothetical protein [Mucilaginibacter sp.]